MALTQNTILLGNRDLETGDLHASTIRAMLRTPIRRSVGASGDAIGLRVEKSEWPAGWKDQGEFIVYINKDEVDGGASPANRLEIHGYRLRVKLPTSIANDLGDPDGTPDSKHYDIVIEARIRSLRDGLGNLLTEGTLNDLDVNGEVDSAGDNYYTIQELAETALSATGLEYESAPAGMNTGTGSLPVDAHGPIDWGNARPIEELEDIVGRIGWTVVQLNNGTLAVRPLLRAGEPIVIPPAFEAVAEPYELASTPSARASTIVITSGSTRATTITQRTLADFDWVVYDPETDTWGDQDAGGLALYKGGITDPTPEEARAIGQLYRAVRLTGDDLTRGARFVNIPDNLDHGALLSFAGGPGVIEALCSVKQAGEQLINTPPLDSDDAIRLDGLRAILGKGVFVLPSSAEFVRVNSLPTGRRSDVRELLDDELVITYAHESNTGDFKTDYFASAFQWMNDEGTITIEELTGTDLDDALDNPNVPKLAAPFLRRVQTYDKATDTHATLNSTQLIAIAKQYAAFHLTDATAQAGIIELRGIHDIDPGDWGGAVTSVTFDIPNHRTVVTINQHEVPGSDYERLQRAAGRSVAAGIGAIRLGRSSAAKGDLRYTLTPEQSVAGSGSGNDTPEAIAVSRGREKSVAGVQGAIDGGPRHGVDLARLPEMATIFARITGVTADGTNRWLYDWEEVRFASDQPVTSGAARTSSTHGKAINTMEMLNDGTGVQGNGVDVAHILIGFAIQPISTRATVQITGPFMDGANTRWYFQAVNAIDGECAE